MNLDFIAFTDHPEHFLHFDVSGKFREVWEQNSSAPFLVIPGYEWASKSYGNYNVYFEHIPNDEAVVHPWSQQGNSLPKLWKALEKAGCDSMSVPHHTFSPVIACYTSCDIPSVHQSAIEIYSHWGQSETFDHPAWPNRKPPEPMENMPGFYADDMLKRGMKLGFVGGTDAHYDFAGEAAVTGAYVDEFSVKGVFDAIKHRRTIAATVPGFKLNYTANGYPMGHVFDVDQYSVNAVFPLKVVAEIEGTSALEEVELIANGSVIRKKTFTEGLTKQRVEWTIERGTYELTDTNRYFYVRARQKDCSPNGRNQPGLATGSPVWIDYQFRDNPTEESAEHVMIDAVDFALGPIEDAFGPLERRRRSIMDL